MHFFYSSEELNNNLLLTMSFVYLNTEIIIFFHVDMWQISIALIFF